MVLMKFSHGRGHARGNTTKKKAKILNVLVACEESQAECEAFRALGHRAFSCDLQPCRRGGHPEWHIRGDCTPLLAGRSHFQTMDGKLHKLKRWDLIVAHPPCTYLCRLSACQLYRPLTGKRTIKGELTECNAERFDAMIKGREFFFKCLNAQATFVAVENPVPMAIAELPKPTCYACPSWFGVKYTKKTCYWLKNLPPIMPEIEYPNPKSFVGSSRGKYRSRTFKPLAQALARQWSEFILDEIAIQKACP